MFKSFFTYVAVAVTLAGCAAGQQINMAYKPTPQKQEARKSSVKVSVFDERSEIKNGRKSTWFIGSYPGSFSIPMDVSNYRNKPLADQISQDLQAELKNLGYQEVAGDQPQKQLSVRILEWSFDGVVNATFRYELQMFITDMTGKQIYAKTLKENKEVEGTVFSGIKPGMEKNLPIFYNGMIRAILRSNKDAMEALQ